MIKEFNKKQCLDIYMNLILSRRFEEKILELIDKGVIRGHHHPSIGMEAIGVGVCLALEDRDIIAPTHRGIPAIIQKGKGEIKSIMAEFMGKIDGCNHGKGGSAHIADLSIGNLGVNGVVGGIIPIATGAALGFKIKKVDRVVVAFYGDGGANQGTVHEAMNMAAIWDLPIVFICENNKYAISTPVEYSSKIKKLSERAKSYGFSGRTVDGMDVLSVYNTAKDYIEKARLGGGPSLIECISYRYWGHSDSEDRLNLDYRTEEEISRWKRKDPIKLWENKILKNNFCKKSEIEIIEREIEDKINKAIEYAKYSKSPKPEDALKGMYAVNYKNVPHKGWI